MEIPSIVTPAEFRVKLNDGREGIVRIERSSLSGGNGKSKILRFAPLHDRLAVKAAVGPQFLARPLRHALACRAQAPEDLTGRVGTAPAPRAEEQLPLLGPEREQGRIADLPVVGFR